MVGVENGQVLVVAGLIDDQINDQQRGVPFLSDIPLLGALFKYRSIDKTKQNLMLFIRPSILRKSADGDYYTRKKYDAVRQAQIDAATGAASLIGGQRPILRRLEDWATRPDSDAPAAAVEDAASAPAAPVAPAPAAD